MLSVIFRKRLRAASLHLLISFAVALLAAGLVFGLWFPGSYRQLAGGSELFLLISGVDVVLGPLLTFAVFDFRKSWTHLCVDLIVIGLFQLTALAYGLSTIHQARPVALVFEKDRFRIITAAQVHLPELPLAPSGYQKLSLSGPRLIGTREPSADEHNQAVFMSIEGIDRAQRPLFWQNYEKCVPAVFQASRSVLSLIKRYPAQAKNIEEQIKKKGAEEKDVRFLPLIARTGDWVILLDAEGMPIAFLPIDGFF